MICTKDRLHDTVRCINSILKQNRLPDEIIVVNTGNVDTLSSKIKEMLNERKLACAVRCLCICSNAGLTIQRNIGVKASSGDIIFFFDDDVVLEEDFVDKIVRVFEYDSDKKIGGASGIITNVTPRSILYRFHGVKREGASSLSCSLKKQFLRFCNFCLFYIFNKVFFLETVGDGSFRLSGFSTEHRTLSSNLRGYMLTEFIDGCRMAYRREVFAEFSFDESLRAYCYMEDADFSYRVSRKYQNVIVPSAKLAHYSHPIAKDLEHPRAKMLIENHWYLFHKNFPQDIKHKIAFYVSIVGLLIQALIPVVGSWRRFRGLLAGLKTCRGRQRARPAYQIT